MSSLPECLIPMIGALFFWLLFSVGVGVLAGSWGRSGIGFFLGSLIITPLLAVILLLIIGRGDEVGTYSKSENYLGHQEKKCPDCAEQVKLEARVCKHCGHEWSEEEVKEEIRKAIDKFKGNLYYCTNEESTIIPHGAMCPVCDGEVYDDDHEEADDHFSES